jgi:starch synthase (maltosyl-transferring)
VTRDLLGVDGPGEGPRPKRIVIEAVTPEVDGGRFAAKRVAGDRVVVEADIFADGHDELVCKLQHRIGADKAWKESALTQLLNDRWRGEFTVPAVGDYYYRIEAWPDRFRTWLRDLRKRLEAGQDVALELKVGGALVREASSRASGDDAARLTRHAALIETQGATTALDETLAALVDRYADRGDATVYDRNQRVQVDRERAGFSAWYELFPRSTSPDPARNGTFRDVIARLPYVAGMGFDVLYLPPATTTQRAKTARPAAPGRSVRPMAVTRASTLTSARSLSFASCWARRRSTGLKSRSTSPSSARRTIPTCVSTRSGSVTGPMVPSATPRTRRSATRTSTRSTSRRKIGVLSGWS